MKWWSSSGSAGESSEAGGTPPAGSPGLRTGSGWFRRRRRRVVAGGSALALYALAGFLLVPWLARREIPRQARALLGREASVQRVRFNPFTFVAVVEGLDLRDRDGAALLTFDRLRVNLQISGVARRAWTFREVELEGPHAVARILADGRPSLADLLESPPQEEAAPPRKMPRLIVHRLAITGGRIDFVDASRAPLFSETLAPLSLEVRGLNTLPDEGGDHALTFELASGARIRWEGRQTIDPLRLEGRVDLTGVPLARVWDFAAGGGQALRVRDGRCDLAFSYDIRKDAAGGIQVGLAQGRVTVSGLSAGPADTDEEWVGLARAEIQGVRAAWPDATLEADRILLDEPRIRTWLAEDGALNWSSAMARTGGAAAPGDAGGEAPAAEPPAWKASAGTVEVRAGAFTFEDRTVQPPVPLHLDAVSLHLEGLSSDPAGPIQVVSGSARMNGSAEAELSGAITVQPFTADLRAKLARVELLPLGPWLSVPGVRLTGGRLEAGGAVRIGMPGAWLSFAGDAALADLALEDAGGGRLAALQRAGARRVSLSLTPDGLRLGELQLQGAFARIHIDRDGNLQLNRIGAAPAPAAAGAPPASGPAPPPSPGTGPSPLFPLDVGRITVSASTVDYADESLALPFASRIEGLKGVIRDLSTTSSAAATLELEGRVDAEGFVRSEGTLRFADPLASSDLQMVFRKVEMPRLTPYAAEFAGYAIRDGLLDVDIRYRIQSRRLVGEHKLVASNLVVGDKVEGGTDAGLPIRLAVALLKDKDGRIDLDVPIEGSVDSPEFAYRKVLWQAVKKILVNVAAAPFRALGRLFGRDEEDLELVGFVAGRGDLVEPEREKLTQLAAQLASRADLTVEIEGRFDPVADPEALKQDALQRRLDEARAAAGDAIPAGAPGLELILERLYEQAFTRERLESERLRFQPPAAPSPSGSAPSPPGGPSTFDATAYYDALRAALLEAEPVGEEDLRRLAGARAQAIATALTAGGALPAGRVKALEPAPVKRKKAGSPLVASEMILTAEK